MWITIIDSLLYLPLFNSFVFILCFIPINTYLIHFIDFRNIYSHFENENNTQYQICENNFTFIDVWIVLFKRAFNKNVLKKTSQHGSPPARFIKKTLYYIYLLEHHDLSIIIVYSRYLLNNLLIENVVWSDYLYIYIIYLYIPTTEIYIIHRVYVFVFRKQCVCFIVVII